MDYGKRTDIQIDFKERVSDEVLFQDYFCRASALVAPSYGEGWGRPQAEAASMGIPVIFTNFSGTTEFLNNKNAFPIEIEKMEVANEEGHLWALPSVNSLRSQMRLVFGNSKLRNEIGIRAREDISRSYSLEVIGRLAWNLLEDIPCIKDQKFN